MYYNIYANSTGQDNKGKFSKDFIQKPLYFPPGSKIALNSMLLYNTIDNISNQGILQNNVLYIHVIPPFDEGLPSISDNNIDDEDEDGFYPCIREITDVLPRFDDIRGINLRTPDASRIYKLTLPNGLYSINALDEFVALRLGVDIETQSKYETVGLKPDGERVFVITGDSTYGKVKFLMDKHDDNTTFKYDILVPPKQIPDMNSKKCITQLLGLWSDNPQTTLIDSATFDISPGEYWRKAPPVPNSQVFNWYYVGTQLPIRADETPVIIADFNNQNNYLSTTDQIKLIRYMALKHEANMATWAMSIPLDITISDSDFTTLGIIDKYDVPFNRDIYFINWIPYIELKYSQYGARWKKVSSPPDGGIQKTATDTDGMWDELITELTSYRYNDPYGDVFERNIVTAGVVDSFQEVLTEETYIYIPTDDAGDPANPGSYQQYWIPIPFTEGQTQSYGWWRAYPQVPLEYTLIQGDNPYLGLAIIEQQTSKQAITMTFPNISSTSLFQTGGYNWIVDTQYENFPLVYATAQTWSNANWFSFNATRNYTDDPYGFNRADVNNGITVLNVRIRPNIFDGGYDALSHDSDVLHSFSLTAAPGNSQDISPKNLTWLNITQTNRHINRLDFVITDQDGLERGDNFTEDVSIVVSIYEPEN